MFNDVKTSRDAMQDFRAWLDAHGVTLALDLSVQARVRVCVCVCARAHHRLLAPVRPPHSTPTYPNPHAGAHYRLLAPVHRPGSGTAASGDGGGGAAVHPVLPLSLLGWVMVGGWVGGRWWVGGGGQFTQFYLSTCSGGWVMAWGGGFVGGWADPWVGGQTRGWVGGRGCRGREGERVSAHIAGLGALSAPSPPSLLIIHPARQHPARHTYPSPPPPRPQADLAEQHGGGCGQGGVRRRRAAARAQLLHPPGSCACAVQ